MPRPRSSIQHIPLLVLLASLFLGLSLGTPDQAGAHADLVEAEPPSEGLLAVPPRQLDLWFSERVDAEADGVSIQLLDSDGGQLPVTSVTVDPNDPKHVIVEIGDIPPGLTTVVWTVRSLDDGHTLSGSYTFRVGAGRAPGAATVEGERPPVWAVITRWGTFLGAAVAAAGFAFRLFVLTAHDDTAIARRRRNGLILSGVAVALIATLLEPLLHTRWPPAGVIAPSLADAIAGLPDAWWWRPAMLVPCLVVALVAFVFGRRGRPLPAVLTWAGLGLALLSLLGLSLTSHASARDSWKELATASNVIHQWSIALWIGGLAQLTLWWASRNRETVEASDSGSHPVRRFSRYAMLLVIVGIGTGIANAGLIFPTLRSLWTSDYGLVLLVKIGVLAMALALAAFNRQRLRGSLAAALPPVRRAVRFETAVVAAVVLGGTVLALLAPPIVEADRPIVGDVPMPVFAAYEDQDLWVHLLFTPGRPGENTLGVKLSEYGGQEPYAGEAPAVVQMRFSNLLLDATSPPVPATLNAEGVWEVEGEQLSVAGWWEIDVILRWLGQEDVVVPFYLIFPDPNLNGLDAPSDDPPSDPAAEELYHRTMEAYTSVHRVRYDQVMGSHLGITSFGMHAVNDGTDGSTPGFTLDIPGGWHYVVLGTTSWSKRPGEAWTVREGRPMVPPSEWDEEYTGARGFQLGRIEEVDGEPSQIITFVVPTAERRVVAWYAWWIGIESGVLHREVMISQAHYMITDLYDYDAPITIEAPEGAPTLASLVP